MESEDSDEDTQRSTNRSGIDSRRHSVLPLQWRLTHSARWMAQVVASALSLLAFLLLMVMVFSKNWLCPSKSRFYQRFPTNVTHMIHTSVHTMTMGLLYSCRSTLGSGPGSCEDSFKLWTNHPFLGVAKINFILALGLGLFLTIWLHLPYLFHLQGLPYFGFIGTILSFSEVVLMFFTLLFFPLNLWLFEVKRNLSVPIGWGYFIGWLVFILYIICAFLCHFTHKNFWSSILKCPSGSESCGPSSGLTPDSQRRKTLLDTFIREEED